jgi:hypothetical protein
MNQREARMRRQLNQRMARQGGMRGEAAKNRNASPYDLERRMLNAKLGNLMPGNVGDINKVVWPFWFTFNAPELSPSTSSTASFTVSQEAAFIWMSFSKVVFKRTGVSPNFVYTAIDPDAEDSTGDANGLNIVFRDSQSSRTFQRNPMPLDAFGSPQFPTVLTTPLMFLPNSTVEVQYSNSNTSDVFVPWITFFGYRVRIENAQDILSLVTG